MPPQTHCSSDRTVLHTAFQAIQHMCTQNPHSKIGEYTFTRLQYESSNLTHNCTFGPRDVRWVIEDQRWIALRVGLGGGLYGLINCIDSREFDFGSGLGLPRHVGHW